MQKTEHVDTSERRLGDAIEIPGDYQHRAITDGPPVQKHWHESKRDLLDWFVTLPPSGHALDVGCGSGVIADAMCSRGLQVTAVDANPDAIAYGRKTFGRPGLEFIEGYLDALELPEQSFDFVTCLELVEHVYPPQIEKLLNDLFRLVKPGGQLLITTPNYRGMWPVIEWAADRFADTANMDADQHVTHLHHRMLRGFVEGAGFEVDRLRRYCSFAPFSAAISKRLARGVDRLERVVDLPFGSLLAMSARRPA